MGIKPLLIESHQYVTSIALTKSLGALEERDMDANNVVELSYIVGHKQLTEAHLPSDVRVVDAIKGGQVADWTALETLLDYSISQGLFQGEASVEDVVGQVPLVIGDSITARPAQRAKMMDLLFDKWQCPGLNFNRTGVLSLFAADVYSSVVIEAGEGCCAAYPVLEGFIPQDAVHTAQVSGASITESFASYLTSRVPAPVTGSSSSHRGYRLHHLAQRLKEAVSVAPGEADGIVPYRLPDGTVIDVPEDMQSFAADAMLSESTGIPAALKAVVEEMTTTQKRLCPRVSFTGGAFALAGLDTAMASAATAIPTFEKIEVMPIESMTRLDDSAWVGGSIVGNLTTLPNCDFGEAMLTREAYDESGAEYWLERRFT